jgi:3-hydroxybutyrate dehydrogenase
MTPSLDHKIALVTGAGRGIGRSIALALAETGADVGVASRNQGELESVAEAIRASGRRALAVACDVTDPTQVAQMTDRVHQELGPVEILVNNAGLGLSHKFRHHPDELWHRMLAINLTSVYYVSKNLVPIMIERRRGRIINIASIASKVGGRYIAAYTAAKHGVLGLTRALAHELAAYNITVNAICPGYVDTPMTATNIAHISRRTGMPEEEARQALEKASPQNRLIEPEEVAAVAVWLASDLAKGITGQAINVDGGAVMF